MDAVGRHAGQGAEREGRLGHLDLWERLVLVA
jgi:hypothetical protein